MSIGTIGQLSELSDTIQSGDTLGHYRNYRTQLSELSDASYRTSACTVLAAIGLGQPVAQAVAIISTLLTGCLESFHCFSQAKSSFVCLGHIHIHIHKQEKS